MDNVYEFPNNKTPRPPPPPPLYPYCPTQTRFKTLNIKIIQM